MSTSIQNLSTFTGLSEVELQRRAQEMVSTGKAKGLSALDAALLTTTTGPKQSTVDAFGAMGVSAQTAHALEEPAQVAARSANDVGFAAGPSTTASLTSANSPAALDKAAASGGERVKGFLGENLDNGLITVDTDALAGDVDNSSRTLEFEKMKTEMQKMSQIMQLMSNVLNHSHETAKAAINNVKA